MSIELSSEGSSKMRGGKRKRENFEGNISKSVSDSIDMNSSLMESFRTFRADLDAHQDKYERLVKISRDITIISKRIIFNLHRCVGSTDREAIFEECVTKFSSISPLISSIQQETMDLDPYLYARAYTNGYQELVEALTFYHFLRYSSLVSYQHLSPFFKGTLLIIDYVLGVLDLTGEMMRACISSITAGDMDTPLQVLSFLSQMNLHLQQFRPFSHKELSNKLRTLSTSMLKVEKACYSLHLRGCSVALIAFEDDEERDLTDMY
ncbi:Translin-associated protein X-like [Oopsacas minuta]|uniref:Translin-associated protein X-like n=1 Tax=Oopsacas minuta TaxID=111878 RepID=A0AAV7KEA5_9METZ|nr:Translin-associated protein X-like [Oopsacas minuta]